MQINVLPQSDRSNPQHMIYPVAIREDGTWDFSQLNEDHFHKVDQMLALMVDKDFIHALVMLWCNYAPDTWAVQRVPEQVMGEEWSSLMSILLFSDSSDIIQYI